MLAIGPMLGDLVPYMNSSFSSVDLLSGDTRSIRYVWFLNVV